MGPLGVRTAARLFLRGSGNLLRGRPLVVSFELTSSCNADCRHCDKGGMRHNEQRLSPRAIGEIYRALGPVAVQLSGGEPLLRPDIVEVARTIREPGGVPYLILVTNGWLLTKDVYLALKEAGMDQLSISLDFPDERHDEFRRLPGLFRRLERIVPELTALGYGDIVINTAITRENMASLRPLCETAEGWGASMSYSAYSTLRTGDASLSVSGEDDLAVLRTAIDELHAMKSSGRRICNSHAILENTWRFFRGGRIPGCRAGYRFLLVTPEGYFRPCAHKQLECRSREELIESFSAGNDCGGCYVAIRSYCDKSFLGLVREQIGARILREI